ncbi:hypothetical protein D6C80_00329 [Aureobasidium pullulans]|nr:hypothetical protein D6C80_00329 [Aureobasidium pullulans]
MTGLRISTIAITSNSSSHDLNYDYVPNAFSFQQGGNVRTLNSGYSPPPSTGLLYVPDLDGVCAQYLPDNVTRYSDLPMVPPKIAIAPWISPACTLSYLNAAPSDLITAFVFYIPNASAMALPSAHDAAWSLGDGGHWKSVINYPVYAIASQVGQMTLEQMARNSSNNTNAPIDQAPSNQTYIRLLMEVTTGSGGTNLPSIWVFLLIILAVLLVLIGALSLTMHILQRKRRNDLRARIARGEVDIEALGLGKLTVPQEMIDRMPLYAYSSSPDPVVPEKGAPHAPPPLQQPICAICLDDFAESASQVRELPCRHIFHPECIDLFMLDSSSICPLCKQSVLPKGYVPGKITNAMTRRERYLRRSAALRARHAAGPPTPSASNIMLFGRHARAPPTNSTTTTIPSQAAAVEMGSMSGNNQPTAGQSIPTMSHGRREWAQRRALAMSGVQSSASEEPERRTSKARKMLRRVFPNL